MGLGQRDRERGGLWLVRISGTAVLVLGVVLVVVLPSAPVHENVPGFSSPIVGFELASRPEHVSGILGAPGTAERAETARRMDLGNRIDFLFALAYAAFYVGVARFLAARGRISRRVELGVYALAATMAAGDWLENMELLTLNWATGASEIAGALELLRVFTLVKWYAIYVASAIGAVGLWREGNWWRWGALFLALAALVGFSSVIHLPAIEYSSPVLFVAWIAVYVRSLR
jgi:hypothetical protein